MRLGPEGLVSGAEFRVTSVKSPILSMEKLVKHGYQFEAGPTGCKMSEGGRNVTLAAVKNRFFLGGRQSLHDGCRSPQR